MKWYSLLSSVLLIGSLACGSSKSNSGQVGANDNQIDEIIYRDWGPPVAPQFNETYKIILNRKAGTLALDSVRTAGVEQQWPLSTEDFDRLLELKKGLTIEEAIAFDGCMGGSGQTLTFFSKGTKVEEGMIVNCGGEQRSNIKGEVTEFTQAIKELVFGE